MRKEYRTGLSYIGKRLLLAVVTLVIISIVIYVATFIVPADPAKVWLGRYASPYQIRVFNRENGLDQSALAGYMAWASHFLTGNLGKSIITQAPVSTIVLPRLERTMLLATLAFLLAVPAAFFLGIITGTRPGSRLDRIISVQILGIAAFPEFVIAVILATIFAIYLKVLPVSSSQVLYGSFSAQLEGYVLPAATLALAVIPHMTRQIRVAVREVYESPFLRAARLRGLQPRVMLIGHLLPSVGARVVNVVALNFAELLAGVVVVETVFAFPGIGQELIQAISSNDVAVMQACAIIIGGAYVALNFLADAIVVALNPRLRRGDS